MIQKILDEMKVSPEENAKKIVEKFTQLDETKKELAKRCAKIVAEGYIKILNGEQRAYWIEVVNEIDKI